LRRNESRGVQRAAAQRRALGLRLWLADVVALLRLYAQGARPGARLPPGAVHPFDAIPRHAPQARAGDGPLPRRLVLGRGLPARAAAYAPRACQPLEPRDAPPRLRAPADSGAAARRAHRARARLHRRSRPPRLRRRARPARPRPAGGAGNRRARSVRRLHPQDARPHARGRGARSAPRAHPPRGARFARKWQR
jgi:hypothetical protein